MTREDEAITVRRVLDGDVNAFEPLVREYEKTVYNLALRTVGNAEDAADITQEAFIRAYNSLPSFRGDSRFSSWLYRIVSNLCLDFLRSRSRHAVVSLSREDGEGEETEAEIADESQSPELLLDRKLTREAVRQGLDALPREQRDILLLREIRGMSYEEIGEALGLEAGTVKSRLFRARKKLCEQLVRDGNIPASFSSEKGRGGERP